MCEMGFANRAEEGAAEKRPVHQFDQKKNQDEHGPVLT